MYERCQHESLQLLKIQPCYLNFKQYLRVCVCCKWQDWDLGGAEGKREFELVFFFFPKIHTRLSEVISWVIAWAWECCDRKSGSDHFYFLPYGNKKKSYIARDRQRRGGWSWGPCVNAEAKSWTMMCFKCWIALILGVNVVKLLWRI